jgi:hypothetical protein
MSFRRGEGWRMLADAERLVSECLAERRESAEESTVRKHVTEILHDYETEKGR